MEATGSLKILGTITNIGDARVWNNGVQAFYPIVFKGEGNEFYGEMCTTKERMEYRGIKVGAIGHMDIEFRMGTYDRAGDTKAFQKVKMKSFTLANSGVFTDNVPAASGAEQVAPAQQVPANDNAVQGELGDDAIIL